MRRLYHEYTWAQIPERVRLNLESVEYASVYAEAPDRDAARHAYRQRLESPPGCIGAARVQYLWPERFLPCSQHPRRGMSTCRVHAHLEPERGPIANWVGEAIYATEGGV